MANGPGLGDGRQDSGVLEMVVVDVIVITPGKIGV